MALLLPPEFKVGALVRLRSGGHVMTVVGCSCCGPVDLAYSHGGQLIEEVLERDALHLLTEDEVQEFEAGAVRRRAEDDAVPY